MRKIIITAAAAASLAALAACGPMTSGGAAPAGHPARASTAPARASTAPAKGPVGYYMNKVPRTEPCLDLASVPARVLGGLLGGTPRIIEWTWNQEFSLGPACIAATTINKGSSVTLIVAHGQKALNLTPMETGSDLANSAPGAQITATDASGFNAYVAIGQRTVLWMTVSVLRGADAAPYQNAAAVALSKLYNTVTGNA
jgi:hypothetical protein